jgi:hypothetical protein
MYVQVNIALLMHTNPQKARFWADLGDFEELALENMYLGCVTALPMYGDPALPLPARLPLLHDA